MNHSLRKAATWSTLAVLLSMAGCEAKEMPDSRRDYLLAHQHGWIDLTVAAPGTAPGYKPGEPCSVGLTINGDLVLLESAHLAGAGAGIPVGFRFVAPAGKLEAALHLQDCVKEELVLTLPLQLASDHLVELAFDGTALKAGAASPFEPASLEGMRGEMRKMQARAQASEAATDKLTRIATTTLIMSALGMLALFAASLRRR